MDVAVTQTFPPLPGADTTPPTELQNAQNNVFLGYVKEHCPVISTEHAEFQKQALGKLYHLFKSWCSSPFHMFVSGSYRLGVHSKDADIDVLFVTTAAITRSMVFREFVQRLQECDDVQDLQPVPRARVPIIGLKLFQQDFDVLTCHLKVDTLPTKAALLSSYEWMNCLEEECILAFNGPRVTEVILSNLTRPTQYVTALRFLRHWAKQRCIYSNKSGYLGGINLSIMLLYIVQRHPCALASTLVHAFFETYAKWKWSKSSAVTLDSHVQRHCPVWLQSLEWLPKPTEIMIILTPCFPRFNTSFTASWYSCQVMQSEFVRAHTLINESYATIATPLDCFQTCSRFIKVAIDAPANPAGVLWQGFVEAQTRHLVQYLSKEELAVAVFRYIPKWSTKTVNSRRVRETYITADDDGKIRSYNIRGNLERPLDYFIREHAYNGPPMPASATVTITKCGRDDLPPDFVAQDKVQTAVKSSIETAQSLSKRQQLKRNGAPVFAPPRARPFPLPQPPAPLQMTVILNPCARDSTPPKPTIIRPLLCNGVWLNSWDVYISKECTMGKYVFAQSVFAVPDNCSDYLAYCNARMEHEPEFVRAVAGLLHKRLACWCLPGSSACHGVILQSLAAMCDMKLQQQRHPVIVLAADRRKRRRR
jgi:poly(A) polymerase